MTRIVKKPEDRRKDIVETAKTLFLENDYQKTTIQDVMHVLGIAKGTIYHYFRSKEDLLEAVVQDIVSEHLQYVKKVVAKSSGSAVDRMKALIQAGNVSQEQDALLEKLHRPGNIEMHSRLLAVMVLQFAPVYAELIEQGCTEGIFHVEHALETAEFLIAGTQFIVDVGCYSWNGKDLERRMQAIPSLLEAQLQAPKGSFAFILN